jgi:hypothetical protein
MTNQNKVKSFILYQEYKKNISLLSQNQKGDLLDAIFSFNEGVEIKLDPIVEMAFSFIKSDLERNKIKYQNIIERNKINGVNGGRPKNPKEPKKPSGLFGNPKEPKETLNDNEDDNEDKDDNKNEECKLINDNLDEIKKNEINLEKPKIKKFIKPSIQEIDDKIILKGKEIDLPEFINKDLFIAFVEMRIKIKKELTQVAIGLLIKKLIEFEKKQAGFANQALENSIESSWQGVFEPKSNNYNSNSKNQTGYQDTYSYNPNNYRHLNN